MDKNSTKLSEGLQALASSAFPRRCEGCGKAYESISDFFTATNHESFSTSDELNHCVDENGTPYLEISRLCSCGSKLKGEFGDRRDTSEAGIRRRKNFSDVLVYLMGKGFEQDIARDELLKLIRGEKSEMLAPYLASSPPA